MSDEELKVLIKLSGIQCDDKTEIQKDFYPQMIQDHTLLFAYRYRSQRNMILVIWTTEKFAHKYRGEGDWVEL